LTKLRFNLVTQRRIGHYGDILPSKSVGSYQYLEKDSNNKFSLEQFLADLWLIIWHSQTAVTSSGIYWLSETWSSCITCFKCFQMNHNFKSFCQRNHTWQNTQKSMQANML